MKALYTIAFILVIIGGLNWGLVGAFDYYLVHGIFGSMSWLERLIYILVGLSAIWVAFSYKKNTSSASSM